MRYKKEHHDPDNWKSLADIFSGLMLMFLLILMLVVLFVGYRDEFWEPEHTGGSSQDAIQPWQMNGGTWETVPVSSHGGGGEETEPAEESTEETYGHDGTAAVQVIVIDEDNQKILQTSGIDFYLLSGDQRDRLTLYTHYPEKVPYTQYETTENGTFFLPEKLQLDTYVLKNISAPAGYTSGGTLEFTIPDACNWDAPFVVYFPLSAVKQTITLRVTDAETGRPVPGGTYEVIATEDIFKADGTYYARAGEVLDQILCDDRGCGQSRLLSPSRHYALAQSEALDGYAVLDGTIAVTMEGTGHKVHEIQAVKTGFNLTLTDELNATPIAGAVFAVYEDNGAMAGTVTTDENGQIRLRDLKKNISYTLEQIKWSGKWSHQPYQSRFTVDGAGRIHGQAVYSTAAVNRMIRVDISLADKITGMKIYGRPLLLRNSQGEIVSQWQSGATAVEGLAPGAYTLEYSGWFGSKISEDIQILDVADIQHFSYAVFQPWIVICAGMIGTAALIGAVLWVWKRKKSVNEILEEEGAAHGTK